MQVSKIAVSNGFSANQNQKVNTNKNNPNFGHVANTGFVQEAAVAVNQVALRGVKNVWAYRDAQREAAVLTQSIERGLPLKKIYEIVQARAQAFIKRGLPVPGEYVPGH